MTNGKQSVKHGSPSWQECTRFVTVHRKKLHDRSFLKGCRRQEREWFGIKRVDRDALLCNRRTISTARYAINDCIHNYACGVRLHNSTWHEKNRWIIHGALKSHYLHVCAWFVATCATRGILFPCFSVLAYSFAPSIPGYVILGFMDSNSVGLGK